MCELGLKWNIGTTANILTHGKEQTSITKPRNGLSSLHCSTALWINKLATVHKFAPKREQCSTSHHSWATPGVNPAAMDPRWRCPPFIAARRNARQHPPCHCTAALLTTNTHSPPPILRAVHQKTKVFFWDRVSLQHTGTETMKHAK